MLIFLTACTAAPSAEPVAESCVPPAAPPAARAEAESAARAWLARCGEAEVVELLAELVAFPTVSEEKESQDAPAFGAMAAFLESWSRQAGLAYKGFGAHDAWEVTLGAGKRHVLLATHADVVPAGEGWSTPPFELRRDGERLYGRGAEDDKGPIAAGLVVLHTLRRFGLTPRGQIALAMGTGEESDWTSMKRYAAAVPAALYTLSLDSSYPVVSAQSGFVGWHIAVPLAADEKKRVLAVTAGDFLTQVPGRAVLELAGFDPARVRAALEAERAERGGPFTYDVSGDATRLVVTVGGVAVHASTADGGHNALWPLASLARRLELGGGIGTMLRLVADKFDRDHYGEKLGMAYADPFMGKLLVSPNVLRVAGGRITLAVNMRRPAGVDSAGFGGRLDALVAKLRRDYPGLIELKEERYIGEPHVAKLDGKLVPTLLDIYRRHTGNAAAQAIAIRGGTYARLFPGAVDFGPSLPELPYRGHAPDEYVELAALRLTTAMLFDALLELDAGAPAAD